MAVNGRSRDGDDVLIAALSRGMTYGQAGDTAGVSERTVRRRMSDPVFRGRVVEMRQEHLEQVRGSLLNAAPAAVATLATLAAEGVSESVRLGAARATLGHVAGQQRSFFDGSMSQADVDRLVVMILETALRFIPDEAVDGFLRDFRAIGRGT